MLQYQYEPQSRDLVVKYMNKNISDKWQISD